jgi:hypothetical protein
MALDLYPNPAKSGVKLPLILPAESNVEITIFDITGKLCLVHSAGLLPLGFNEVSLLLEHFQPGLYFIRCNAGGALITKKLLIQ